MKSAANSASPSAGRAERRGRARASPTTAMCWKWPRRARRRRRAAARHGDIQEFYLGQSPGSDRRSYRDRQAISPQSEVVWLSLRLNLEVALWRPRRARRHLSCGRRGELLALIGPNGAGKTSVLNCVSGIYHGEGASAFAANDIAGPPHEIARLGIARTFQHGELFPQ